MAGRMKIRWWDWLPFRRWRVVEIVDDADEVPAQLPPNGVALVGDAKHPKWIVFDCPCRGGHRIMINADRNRKPSWQLGLAPTKRLTISPSVDYADGQRRCHYFVRDGKIVWAKDSFR